MNLLGYLNMSHATMSKSERVLFADPNAVGMYVFCLQNVSKESTHMVSVGADRICSLVRG